MGRPILTYALCGLLLLTNTALESRSPHAHIRICMYVYTHKHIYIYVCVYSRSPHAHCIKCEYGHLEVGPEPSVCVPDMVQYSTVFV